MHNVVVLRRRIISGPNTGPARPVVVSGDSLPLPPAAGGLSPLLRRLRSYRRAGQLVGLLEFMRRRTACRDCERAKTRPTHPGLYGCGSCSTCTGGPERMLIPSSKCARGLWPKQGAID